MFDMNDYALGTIAHLRALLEGRLYVSFAPLPMTIRATPDLLAWCAALAMPGYPSPTRAWCGAICPAPAATIARS